MDDAQERSPSPRAVDFDETFRRCYQPMVRTLAVASGDREVAADCRQEAFLRAYPRWRRVSRLEDPVGWIRHVAINKMRDHFRKVERGRRAFDRVAGESETTASAPDEPSELAALLASLPVQQRIAAALFYVDDLSVAEIAETMKLSEGAVKYHLHAGAPDAARRAGAAVVTDERDDLDRALAAGLGRLGDGTDDPDAVLAAMRPRLRRARTRHRVAIASVAVASVLGVAGIAAALNGANPAQRHVSVATAPSTTTLDNNATSTTRASDVSSTTVPTRPTPTTAAPPTTPTTDNHGGGSNSGPGSHGSGPGPSGGNNNGGVVGPTPTTTAAPPQEQSCDEPGGSATVRYTNGKVTLVSYTVKPGYTLKDKLVASDRVELQFDGPTQSRIEIRVENGHLVVHDCR